MDCRQHWLEIRDDNDDDGDSDDDVPKVMK